MAQNYSITVTPLARSILEQLKADGVKLSPYISAAVELLGVEGLYRTEKAVTLLNKVNKHKVRMKQIEAKGMEDSHQYKYSKLQLEQLGLGDEE